MGLFDIFKRKRTDAAFPENELEKILMESATKASARKAFYHKLLWNELFVLTNGQVASEEGVRTLDENTTVRIVTFETGEIPVFTSTNRIFDKGVIKEKVPFIGMKGQDLFGLVQGATFILNPYSDYGKELLPKEIEGLLDGTIFEQDDAADITEAQTDEFNKLFDRAGRTQEGLIFLDGYRHKALRTRDKNKLERSITDFQKCLEISPEHWQSMFLMAKAYQRLEKHAEALELLEKAVQIDTENHFIPMEASLEAMSLDELEKALFYSEESLRRNPNDFTLMGNHAMNLLVASKDEEAKSTIEQAIQLQPNDSINKNVHTIIHEVIAGKRQRPTFEDVTH